MRLLLVEDKQGMRDMLTRALTREGYEVTAVADGEQALKALQGTAPDLVLTDLKLPVGDGLEVLGAAREISPDLPVLVMTAYGSIESAVAAMRQGAYDFITKPFDPDHLMLVLAKALEARRLVTENLVLRQTARHQGVPAIIGESAALKAAIDQVQRVAAGDTTVLLGGESGTGKELFAELVHAQSPRAKGPFVAVNCAAVPEHLLESEFFGHEKGAFTGADSRRLGKFELARNGTIFLDEIGDMDLTLQAKLLRVLQNGEMFRVGGERPVPLDVRVVAATHRDLGEMMARGAFREDLFYRLSTFPVRIPPLRERREDIALLATYFVTRLAAELGRGTRRISPAALSAMAGYHWPGNVRELQNCIERAVILSTGEDIAHVDLGTPGSLHGAASAALSASGLTAPAPAPNGSGHASDPPLSLAGSLHEVSGRAARHYESLRIRQALDEAQGNKSRAAELLEVSYKTLLTKIRDYAIEPVESGGKRE
ncbi:MAG: sigma-54 dependent transcriptional regulator [Nitrospirota bacterium]|nr:sigma-54 dependent transcriptional regulator [Nitrospirota bacterium]